MNKAIFGLDISGKIATPLILVSNVDNCKFVDNTRLSIEINNDTVAKSYLVPGIIFNNVKNLEISGNLQIDFCGHCIVSSAIYDINNLLEFNRTNIYNKCGRFGGYNF
jgi:hypothetical protein